MSAEDATAGSVRIVLRGADRQVLAEAARSRKQSLEAFLSETLACAAVDLRQPPPRAALTWADTFSRHAEPEPKPEQDYEAVRPWRHRRMPTAGSK